MPRTGYLLFNGSENEFECVRLLLEAGADPTTSSAEGMESFMTKASRDGSMVMIEFSIDLAWC